MTIFFMVCMVDRAGAGQPLGLLPDLGVHRGRPLPPRAALRDKFLPFSLGLFLAGRVPLLLRSSCRSRCSFLLEFNVWLGIEPTLRLVDWMSFATILPLVFGVCFQTPLIMLFLERIGIFTVDDFRAKRKIAILIIVVAAAVLTPGPGPVQHVPARRADDPPLRAGDHPDRIEQEAHARGLSGVS